MNSFNLFHHHSFHQILLILAFMITPIVCLAQDVQPLEGGKPNNNTQCSNYNINTFVIGCLSCCGAVSAMGPFSSNSGMGPGTAVGGMAYSPFLHNGVAPTGGMRTSGIGSNFVAPGLVFRSISFWTQDADTGRNVHSSFDARITPAPEASSNNYRHYRDDYGNVYWYGLYGHNSSLGGNVYRAQKYDGDPGPGLLGGGTAGYVGVIVDKDAGGYDMIYSDGRKRIFNDAGWLTQDIDQNGNAINYVRDNENFVTEIQLPVENGYSRSIDVNHEIYRYGGGGTLTNG